MSDASVIVRVDGAVGRLSLNRPEALHALNTAMCEAMIEALLAWRGDASVPAVLIDHASGRGFCAGGDIRMLAESGAGDAADARRFFHTEYRLNHLLFEYPKPVIAIMDGVVMGGGVGISLPAPFRVATERTTFAMPETGIGLFPDVGGGWHLPRLPGQSGMWLALTGARLKGADCLALGVATHFVESGKAEGLKAVLSEAAADGGDAVEDVLSTFQTDPGPASLAPFREAIDRHFGADDVESVFKSLEADGSDWVREQLATLRSKSPQTLKVAFRQLRTGAQLTSFGDNMAMEYRIGSRVVRRHDFLEGVRAVIVDKDNAPRWDPPALADVSAAVLDEIFAPLPDGEEWTPLP